MGLETFPIRQIHLDFHTSPALTDVGADWNAGHFIETLKRARVNSVNLFAKCHHGLNYYPSEIGPVHPHLKFDLLGAQIEACHQANIRCPIYLSVGFDVETARRRPDWRQLDREGRLVGSKPLAAQGGVDGWPWMCLNNGYADEVIAQTEELIGLYECDGFWFDILWYDPAACLCVNCLASMEAAGLNPENPLHRDVHTKGVLRSFMERASATIRAKLPQATIFYNRHQDLELDEEAGYYSQLDVESLPTGGWGYGYFPLWARQARLLGQPMVGMTGRFHRSWADWGGLKHPDALRWECGMILATGGGICIGDQMHPRGRLIEAVYEVIGEAFQEVEAVEEYCQAARPVSEVGLLLLDTPSADRERAFDAQAAEGASKMLLELHQQFDVLSANSLDFSFYKVLIIPDSGVARPELVERLRRFIARGGKLLLSHQALLDPAIGNFALAAEMGLDYAGSAESNPDYFVLTNPALYSPVTRPGFPYSLYDGPTSRVVPGPATELLADAYETYFNRSWRHFSSHGFTPPRPEQAEYPAVTLNNDLLYIYGPVFRAYQKYGNLTFRGLVGQCLKLLLPQPLVETDAPSTAEISLLEQPGRQIVHLVNYHASRRTVAHVEALETPVPLRDVRISLTTERPVERVWLARTNQELPFETNRETGQVKVSVPRVDIHEIVLFEEAGG